MTEKKEMDFEKFEELLQTKSYAELNQQELPGVNQWVESEQEYEALRTSGLEMKRWFNSNSVVPSTKESLQALKVKLKLQHQQTGRTELKPVWGYAVTALIFGLLGWWVRQPELKPVVTPVVEKILVRDTVYIATKPDTIYLERFIYRETSTVLTKGTRPETQRESRGVSMKEKEELDKLLVSGSE